MYRISVKNIGKNLKDVGKNLHVNNTSYLDNNEWYVPVFDNEKEFNEFLDASEEDRKKNGA